MQHWNTILTWKLHLLVLLQVQERDGVPEADEGVLVDGRDVVRAQVQVPKTVQRPQCLARDPVQVVIAEAQILQIFCKGRN